MKNNGKKLDAIAALVKEARKVYNNEDAVIDAPDVVVCGGKQNIKYLSDSDKAAVAGKELQNILTSLNALDATTQGVNIKRELTGALATNPILTNIGQTLALGLE